MSDKPLISATRPIDPETARILRDLKPGQKIRITRTVVINSRHRWPAHPVEGIFSHYNYLATGLSTDRVREDDIVVVAVHFEKLPGKELSSITLDQYTKIEVLG